MVKKKKVAETKVPDVRETYLQNRNNMLEDFRSSLKEVQRDIPSVGGIIAGMDFRQLSACVVFMSIGEQEEYVGYIKQYKPEYANLKEEQKILKEMVKEAKAVFGDQYQIWYDREKDK